MCGRKTLRPTENENPPLEAYSEATGWLRGADRLGKTQVVLHLERQVRINFSSSSLRDAGLRRIRGFADKLVAVLVLDTTGHVKIREVNARMQGID